MELSIAVKGSEQLTTTDKTELDAFIAGIISTHSKNTAQINKFALDSVTALTASGKRGRELSNQGFFKRMWGGLTGSNRKLQDDIDKNLAKAQYASTQMLQKLSEQNLMSFEMIAAVNNKLNSSLLEMDA